MKKEEVRQRIIDIGIVPVLRVSSPQMAFAAAEAVCRGGIPIIEVTMTIPKAVAVIQKLTASMGRDAIVGAGTVLDPQTAQQCLDAGAEFLVSPVLNAEITALAARESKLVMAGALTPNEIVSAWNSGCDFVKVFPCSSMGGPKYIKSLKGPFPDIPLVPTGGVSLDTAEAHIAAGAAALGVGSELISESELAAGHHAQITRLAQQFAAIVREARQPGESVAAGTEKVSR